MPRRCSRRRAGCARAARPAHGGDGLVHAAAFDVAEGETVDLQLSWFPAYLTAPEPLDVDACIADTAAWWRSWVRSLHRARRLRRGGAAVAPRAAAADPRGHRRHRRGRDDEPARGLRRRAQLGLPVRLAAGCRAHARVAAAPRLHPRGAGVAAVAAAGDRGRSGRRADRVRAGGGAAPGRVGGRHPARLRRQLARARRQRGIRAVPGRRLRRGDDRARRRPAHRGGRRRLLVVAAARTPARRPRCTSTSPTRASGRSAGPSATSPTRARCCGPRSTGRSARSNATGGTGPVERWRDDPRADRGADRAGRLRRRPRQLRAVRGHDRGRRRPAPARADRLRGLRRPADAGHRRADRGDADPRRARAAATARRPRSTASPATRTRSSPARSGSSSSTRTAAGSTTPSRSWTCSSRAAATSDCSPSRRPRRPGGRRATRPQALSHLALVRAADAIAHARGVASSVASGSVARSSRG